MKTVYESFADWCKLSYTLFVQKNTAYGSAFLTYGLLGVVCEILGAAARLPQLVLWNDHHGSNKREVLIDILSDLHNYANMALICIERENWDGRITKGDHDV